MESVTLYDALIFLCSRILEKRSTNTCPLSRGSQELANFSFLRFDPYPRLSMRRREERQLVARIKNGWEGNWKFI